ncbi:MAG: fused MFS/spermidine synthase [Actinomycetota bacterium]|nr:fused MFS/spermidine synthase [Actinomycetota bacterium]
MAEIYSHTSAFHDINVADYDFLRVLSFGHNRQSSMYLDAPFDTDFEYPGYFHVALAIKPDAARTLAIGLGGGTVVKRMWRDYPKMRIDSVEIDPEVVEVARRFFELPQDERIRIFVDDGRRFLETRTDLYDIVIVDAFLDDVVPPALTSAEFLHTLKGRLTPDGVTVYNFMGTVHGEGSEPFRALHQTLTAQWSRVWVFVINESTKSGAKNLILLATDAVLTTHELRARIADRVGGLVSVPAFHLFGEDLYEDTPGVGVDRL